MGKSAMEYMDIHSIMLENSKRFGSKDYIVSVDQRKKITFSQINDFCNKVANFLRNKGIGKEDIVSLVGKNSIETMIVYLGVLKYGATINPINSEESNEYIRGIIDRVRPKIVFYDEETDLKPSLAPFSWIKFSNFQVREKREEELFSLIRRCDSAFQTPIGSKDDIAEILFTSGTTETPKGVVISREGLFYMVEEVIDKMKITAKDRILEYRAYSWASPQLLSILPTMKTGATLVLAKKFSRSKFPRWLKEYSVTISTSVPTVINILVSDPVRLHKEDVPTLKFITCSSAPLSIEKHRAFEHLYGIPINQMAGITETGFMAGNPLGKRKTGSIGTPTKYKRISIVNQHGEECGVGEEGEIVVKGKYLAVGYLNDHGGIDSFPSKGFHTGDMGHMDSDGYVFITGRKKDLIIKGGVNISPMEITNRLMEHSFVKDAATVGVPDKIYGEEVVCFVVPKPVCNIKEQDILSHCKETLPEFKLPKLILFLEEIPKTERGKVAKHLLMSLINQSNSRRGSRMKKKGLRL